VPIALLYSLVPACPPLAGACRLSVTWRTLSTLHTATQVRECIKRALKCQSFYTTMKFNGLPDDRFIASALFNSTYVYSYADVERRREEERKNMIGVYPAWDRNFDSFRRRKWNWLSMLMFCFPPLFFFYVEIPFFNLPCFRAGSSRCRSVVFRRILRRSKRRIVVISFCPNACADIHIFTDSCTLKLSSLKKKKKNQSFERCDI